MLCVICCNDNVVCFSLLSHKEFRFLMGLLPFVMHVCGCTLHQLLDIPSSEVTVAGTSKHDSQSNNGLSRTSKDEHVRWKTFVLVCLISTNLPIALYTGLIHQRGTIDVMTFLYAEAQKPVSKDLMSVLFLMPCHSTPFYRYQSLVLELLQCNSAYKWHFYSYGRGRLAEFWLALTFHLVSFSACHILLASVV